MSEAPWRTIERLTRLINEGTITKEQAKQLYREEHAEDEATATYFASLSKSEMCQILVTHGIQVDPAWTRQELQEIIMQAGIGGPPVETTTDTDTPAPLFGLLTRILLHREASIGSELSRAAMKQRLLGELDAIHWVMQQVEDIIEANRADTEAGWGVEITNEPCNTCHGQGWVIEGQSMGFPSGEQIECPDCGEFPENTPRTGRLSQLDPFQQSIPPGPASVMHTNIKGKVMVKSNGKWVEMGNANVVTFTCPQCGAISYNPNDAQHGYCGACHAFTGLQHHHPVLLPPAVAKSLREASSWRPEDFTHGRTSDSRLSWDIS